MNLAEALPKEIERVRELQDEFKELRKFPNVIVEPQIAMMERSINNAIKVSASGDCIEMLKAFKDLEGYEG